MPTGKLTHFRTETNAPLRPLNVYGRCKVEGERLVETARGKGLRAAVVRLSNVYGSAHDHTYRVSPAFARAAVRGSALRVEGETNLFDFTHLDDTVRGILAIIRLLSRGQTPLPINLLAGRRHTLGEVAKLAVELAGTRAETAGMGAACGTGVSDSNGTILVAKEAFHPLPAGVVVPFAAAPSR